MNTLRKWVSRCTNHVLRGKYEYISLRKKVRRKMAYTYGSVKAMDEKSQKLKYFKNSNDSKS